MKNLIFNIFKNYFIKQIRAFALSKFPLQVTTKTATYSLIKVKKGKIRQLRLYDNSHNRIHNFSIDRNENVIINH